VAFDELKTYYASSPERNIYDFLKNYGTKLNKSTEEIQNDVYSVQDAMAKPATNFKLKSYYTGKDKSLADYRGKVVFITYWFPGCGPCRGEFPHFQEVVDKFKDKDLVYLGINIVPDQNDYVVPFLKSSGYSFEPLEDYPDRQKGNLDNRGAAPANFLIDRKGNLIYSNFRTNEHNKDVLEEMINSLLNRN
jgi:thiol-disulfide isomerase/thioredoxin